MIKAALFDMDGLLLDSERIHLMSDDYAARKLGYTYNEEIGMGTLGLNAEATTAYYSRFEPAFDPKKFWPLAQQFMEDYARSPGIPLKPYAREILESFRRKGILCALVTSSARRDAELYLTECGLAAYLPVIVSGDLALPGKPAPDGYLRAAALLGVDIAQCGVLEDSMNGLRAGRAAGAITVMVPDLLPWTEAFAPYCDFVAPTLKEAEAFLCR